MAGQVILMTLLKIPYECQLKEVAVKLHFGLQNEVPTLHLGG